MISLIICTYERSKALQRLLKSLQKQSLFPDEVLIIDGSHSDDTQAAIKKINPGNLLYFRVDDHHRGLTKQRNFGVKRVSENSRIILFLDDDVILDKGYIEEIIKTYNLYPDALGVGGYITNEVNWIEKNDTPATYAEFQFDGWRRQLGRRYSLRKRFNLSPKANPGFMPESSHGYPIHFLPPSGKVYPVEYFMGGVASYRAGLFKNLKFSSYFEGYGLYEDMDFCLRASKHGNLYVNTKATLTHYHENSGRPNKYIYGKMVLRNGWYVWRIKYPDPSTRSIVKWHATEFLLFLVRLGNVFSTKSKKEALTESIGRLVGWWSLIWNSPNLQKE
ncbi:glycosyltransferase [Salinimicrobium catena]|uniref:glycosyltransferase family 2 protein n=1 Tax=Salinimicrobium catena TaxID=390640 RepID=UPI002FE43308